jgi:methylglutaconyl-CoA hydratase
LVNSLKEEIRRASEDREISAIIITGAGQDFCAGADLSELERISTASYEENLADARNLGELFILLREIEKPVIAAVRGNALAGGCGLAMACDIVIATHTAKFGFPEVKIGFVPAMVAAILRRSVGEKVAFELATTARIITAEEAKSLCIVTQICGEDELEDEATKLALKYAQLSPVAISETKKLLYATESLDFKTGIEAGARVNAKIRMSEECRSKIKAFLEKNLQAQKFNSKS